MSAISQIGQAASIPADLLCASMTVSKATYYRHLENIESDLSTEMRVIVPETKIILPDKIAKNALNNIEKQNVIELLHSERFVDKTPYEIYYELIDQGEYYCSIRTMYRILTELGESQDRRLQRNHRDAIKPQLIATRSNEVWSWDITKLLGPQKWVYYHLYVIMDIFSRYVVGWLIADRESKELADLLISETALKHGINPDQLTLHSDNGPSMTSHTVAQLLEKLGISKTHNRPYTSNDNPFSESQFKTMKYKPGYPDRFPSIIVGEAFSQEYFGWYNNDHYHSALAWLTPESVHNGRGEDTLQKRHETLMNIYQENPRRFNNQPPKLQKLPKAVYINPPTSMSIKKTNRTESEEVVIR